MARSYGRGSYAQCMYVCSYSGRVSTLEQAVPTRTAGAPPRAPAMPTWMPRAYAAAREGGGRICMYVLCAGQAHAGATRSI